MSEGNLISWAGSQPIWIQVFIGLTLFFVGLPLALFLISELFSSIGNFITSITNSFSKEAPSCSHNTAAQKDEFSDEILIQALCRTQKGRKTEMQIKDFLAPKSAAEKSALKRNPMVLRAIEEMANEVSKI